MIINILLGVGIHAKTNADKTEVIVFTSEHNAGLVNDISMTVGDSDMCQRSCCMA